MIGLEVVKAQLFLEPLMGLLTDPTGLDDPGQFLERCVGRQVAGVVFALAGGTVLADQPDLLAGQMLLAKIANALRRSVGDTDTHGSEPG